MVHPNAGADKRDAVGGHLRKILFPHRRIARAREIPAIFFCGEVVGADWEEWFSTASEKIAMDPKGLALVEGTALRNPETILVELAKMSLLAIGGANLVEAGGKRLLERRREDRRFSTVLNRQAWRLQGPYLRIGAQRVLRHFAGCDCCRCTVI